MALPNMSIQKQEPPHFIFVQGQRIRINTIQRYIDSGEGSITFWFSYNINKPNKQTFNNLSTESKTIILQTLDYWLL